MADEKSANPYRGLPDHQMWRRAVSRVEPTFLDPALTPGFRIGPGDKVATAGSCFAQHISARLAATGLDYFCPESHPEEDPSLDDAAARAAGYGIFSARYGNIYTVQQLCDLFEAAMGEDGGEDTRAEPPWTKEGESSGRLYDPYRPNAVPGGFESAEALAADRARHLAAVRRIFTESAVFVFTLGLTEAWRSKVDGSVFPLAPGVVAGRFDPEAHEFHNFTMDETRAALFRFLARFHEVNPTGRVLLTVSPVPLIATYEPRHVLTSTIHSKSILRVAAGEAEAAHDFVDYFPSYEIITGPPTGGLYYEADQREVNARGVAHAMAAFMNAYVGDSTGRKGAERGLTGAENRAYAAPEEALRAQRQASGIVCDEEEIERSLK